MNKKQLKTLYQQAVLELNGQIQTNNSLIRTLADYNTNGVMYEQMLIANDIAMHANRFMWENLPINLTSQQLEAMFYQHGALCFYANDVGNLQISKFAITGKLNPYGQLTKITPIDFGGKKHGSELSVIQPNGVSLGEGETGAVIIYDYTTFAANPDELSRFYINKHTTIKDEIEVYRQLRNLVKIAVKKAIILCDSEEQRDIVKAQAHSLLNPDELVAVMSSAKSDGGFNNPLELFNINSDMQSQNYCQLIDYYNKVRRNFGGIPSPDTFEKRERKIVAEAENTNAHTQLKLFDGLYQRLNGLDLVKKYVKANGVENISVDINPVLLSYSGVDDENSGEKEEQEHDEQI